MREVEFAAIDFDLFDKDISPTDYDFFKKHTGAFKRLLEDQSKDKRYEFIHAFEVFSMKHGCIKKLGKGDETAKYVKQTIEYYRENFVDGKLGTAKMLVDDAVCLAQSRPMLQNLGTHSHAKDPFCHKDTRDTFRRLFGHPSDEEAFMKILCALPLHLKFGGSLCRYLRRWLETDDTPDEEKLPSERIGESFATAESDQAIPNTKSKAMNRASEKNQKVVKTSDIQGKIAGAKYGKSLMSGEVRKPSSNTMELVVSDATDEQRKGSSKNKVKSCKGYLPFRLGVDDDTQSLSFASIDEQTSDESTIRETEYLMRQLREVEARDGDDGSTCQLYRVGRDGSLCRMRDIMDALHLGKPHPNEIYDQMCKEKEGKKTEKAEEGEARAAEGSSSKKLHSCSNCRKVEDKPRSYKKCQRCKGKGTRFYCSRECQVEDWTSRHRQEHDTLPKN